jgi:glycosyltransferase involved in cell wall biosynthesis
MKINIVLPFFPKHAVGGIKVLYQYADFLSERGHDVTLYHTSILKNVPKRYLNIFRVLRFYFRIKKSIPKWFTFKNQVTVINILKISNKSIFDGDVIISTMYATALDVFSLSESKGRKINFIQDYETWIAKPNQLILSYRLPVIHIVINDYLYSIVEKYSPQSPVLIYNAIDTSKFYITKPIEDRQSASICMMYSEEQRKGSIYGINAIKLCKEKYPDLVVNLFSVFPKPEWLPDWINFHQSPNNLNEIYNSSAIFISPSLGEGWALPPAEAMCCGCALICTDIGGHAAYAKDKETALLVSSEDPIDLADKISTLIEDNQYRIQLARKGNDFIKRFSWKKSVDELEKILTK